MTPDTITLKAGSIYPVRVQGKYLTIISCTAALSVELDRGGRVKALTGSQFGSDAGFSTVSFIEINGADNVVSYTISDTPSPGRTTAVQASAGTFAGANSGNLAASGNKTFLGTDSEGRERKVIYLSNPDSAALLGVANNNTGAIYALIQPKSSAVPIETNADLAIGYVGTATFAGCVLEIFYSKPVQSAQ